MLESGVARYGFWNCDGGIPVDSDQQAIEAPRSSPSCRYRRNRSRVSSISKNIKVHVPIEDMAKVSEIGRGVQPSAPPAFGPADIRSGPAAQSPAAILPEVVD